MNPTCQYIFPSDQISARSSLKSKAEFAWLQFHILPILPGAVRLVGLNGQNMPMDIDCLQNLHFPFLMIVILDDCVTGYALAYDYFNFTNKTNKKKPVCSAPVS